MVDVNLMRNMSECVDSISCDTKDVNEAVMEILKRNILQTGDTIYTMESEEL